LSRKSNQLVRARIRQFESYMPSQAVRSPRANSPQFLFSAPASQAPSSTPRRPGCSASRFRTSYSHSGPSCRRGRTRWGEDRAPGSLAAIFELPSPTTRRSILLINSALCASGLSLGRKAPAIGWDGRGPRQGGSISLPKGEGPDRPKGRSQASRRVGASGWSGRRWANGLSRSPASA
jgi:hypothetical protein